MASYMISLRDTDNDAVLGAARYLVIDDSGGVQQVAETFWRASIIARFPVGANAKRSGDILFFVHGFNVGFQSACADHGDYRQRLAANGWPGLLISFDWPSHGSALAYFDDEKLAGRSASDLIDTALGLFVSALDLDCDIRVSVMAHSMGALVVRQALVFAHHDTAISSKNWNLSQLVLVAGDIPEGSLSVSADGGLWIDKYVSRTTNYSNRFDSVLKISDVKNGDPTPRVGRVGLPADAPSSFCNVDTSDFYGSVDFGVGGLNPATPHTYYFGQDAFWQDVVLTLGGGIDRKAIPTRQIDPDATVVNRFLLQGGPMAAADFDRARQHALLGN